MTLLIMQKNKKITLKEVTENLKLTKEKKLILIKNIIKL